MSAAVIIAFISRTTTELTVDSRHSHVQVATDGEVTLVQTPLHYRIRARALTVIVPAENAAGSAASEAAA